MKKIALITGANRGIGFETARQLAKKNYTVLLGARDPAKGMAAAEKLRKEDLDVHYINISPSDPKSVKSAAEEVASKFGLLDVLINNAGVFLQGDNGPASEVPTDILRETYETNVFGLHEVTKAFWPLLNKSEAARLVNVSSALGSLTMHDEEQLGGFKVLGYDSSKAAVNMMTIHYADQWKNTPHRANTIHPGSVKTDMNKQGELSLEEGAKTSVDLATIPDNGPNGKFFHLGKPLPW
jgi:NAD(P)-dependent dehydrogenase (short-subunit alcohol dehydrogenase family)